MVDRPAAAGGRSRRLIRGIKAWTGTRQIARPYARALRTYVINLDDAADRWVRSQRLFAAVGITPERVPAVDGRQWDAAPAGFDERRYRLFHGRAMNPRKVAVFQSQVKAIRRVAESGDEFGLICEDDLTVSPDLPRVLDAAVGHSRSWDVLRLTGLSEGTTLPSRRLCPGYRYGVMLGRMKGSGAYVVKRRAAERLARRLTTQWLPWDHTIDREWWYGLRAARVVPFPASQTDSGLGSSTEGDVGDRPARGPKLGPKLPEWRRWATTYPYQLGNESARLLARSAQWLAVTAGV